MAISCNLFKNTRRENDRQPEYRGDGKDEAGTEYWISAWVKEGKNGKYFSVSIQPKEQQSRTEPERRTYKAGDPVPESYQEPSKDDLPF